METESGAKIAIRGKGSVKEGKGRSDAAHASNQEEDLHCLIMADTEDKVNKAKKLIHNVIETAASIPEGQNELKRNQLRELAALNGTLRDDENQACQNCGQIGHRKYDCPEKQNFTASIICRVCGNAGHMARDCPDRQRGASWRNDGPRPQGRLGGGGEDDAEYEHPRVSRPDLAHTATAMPNRGSADLQVDLLPGDPATTTASTTMVAEAEAEVEVRVVLRRGPETDVSAIMTTTVVIATTGAVRTMATARHRLARRRGSKLPVLKAGMVALLHPAQRHGSRPLVPRPLTVDTLAAMARLQVSGHLHHLHRPLITSRR
ncbi:hypothetical protein F5883DRAFT_35484 [Diaporthe sp. PMI_573]|nr:hypothetical protein F5883DRAFT_35484 [Diaporthaceae sp. PMI_573]